jgi:DNA-binding MarR family transcriptional regulator
VTRPPCQNRDVDRGDHVDHLLEQWHEAMPDLDPSPMAVVARVSRLGRIFNRRVEELYARYGLNQSQFGVLAALRRAGPPYCLSPTELYNSLLVTSGAMTNRLERLAASGYIERIPDPKDGRSMLVALTPAGKRLIERVVGLHYENEHRLLSPLSPEERTQLADLLRRLLLELEDDVSPPAARWFEGTPSARSSRRRRGRSAPLRRTLPKTAGT